MHYFEKFLITCGDNHGEIWCQSPAETLEANLRECAEQALADGEDVSLIRVWKMTEIRVEPDAFKIDNLAAVLKEAK